jgi:predicted O-methyltransferase YrrM
VAIGKKDMAFDFAALNAHIADIPSAQPDADAAPRLYAPSFRITTDGLEAWRRSEAFPRVLRVAHANSLNSLMSDESRALLYHLIITMRPQRVLEIGTYRAGTSRWIARALYHAGGGALYTIDPWGIQNEVPEAIARWPEHLQHHVRFFALPSALFFGYALPKPLLFDLVLIDGDHEFEAATYDLGCVARLIRPSGVVVLDNVDQPGPRFTTIRWLDEHPEWREIGSAVEAARRAGPLDDVDGSFFGTKFFVIRAPADYAVSGLPRSFGSMETQPGTLVGIVLTPSAPTKGELHYRVFSRAFGPGQLPEELTAAGAASIETDGGAPIRIELESPLTCQMVGDDVSYRCEIILAFRGEPMSLAQPPDLVVRGQQHPPASAE